MGATASGEERAFTVGLGKGGFAVVHENVNAAAAPNDSSLSSSVVD
jgi:hypothetical protein